MACGRLHVDEMLDELDEDEFREWQEFARLEPFGPAIDDLRGGMILAALHEPYRDAKRKNKPFSADDFRLGYVPKRRQTLSAKALIAKTTAILGPPQVCQLQ